MPDPTPAQSPADGVTRQDAETLKSLKGTLSKKSGCLIFLGSLLLGATLGAYGGVLATLGGKRVGPDRLWDKVKNYGYVGPSAEDVETVTHYRDGKEVKKYNVKKGLKTKILDFRDKRIQSKNDKGEPITIDDVVSDLELMGKCGDSRDYDISEQGFERVNQWYQGRNYGSKMPLDGVK